MTILLPLAAVLGLLLCARSGSLPSWLDAPGTGLDRLSRRPVVAGFALFGLAVAWVSSVTQFTGIPSPAVHDEFGYLLAAETFLEGRLTNPTHEFWQHFETFHVLHQPSYASKYPPAMGLLLAGGASLGHPIVGVWIATGLAAVGVYWMLLGWLPRRWALVGGLIACLHPFVLLNWGQGYWGGELPLLGGALVFGAVPRLRRRAGVVNSLWLAVGVGLLANCRPFEGFVACLPVAVVLGCRTLWGTPLMCRESDTERHTRGVPPDRGRNPYLLRFVLPTTAVLAVVLAGMLRYNAAVTGHPLRMPYTVHHAQYEVCPVFLWQPLQPEPEYRHRVMRDFYTGWGLNWYTMQRDVAGIVAVKGTLLGRTWWGLVGGLLTVPVVIGLVTTRGWNGGFVLVVLGLSALANLSVPWLLPHYLAPVMPLLLLAGVRGLRSAVRWTNKSRVGWARPTGEDPFGVDGTSRWAEPTLRSRAIGDTRGAGRFVTAFLLLCVTTLAAETANHLARERSGEGGAQFTRHRARVLEELQTTPGDDLVFVHYESHETRHREWVFNAANIDAAAVVWAREMSPERDAALRAYFANRRVWRLDADAAPPRLVRLPSQQGTEPTSPERGFELPANVARFGR